GWTAHVMELRAANALTRPLSEYSGPDERPVPGACPARRPPAAEERTKEEHVPPVHAAGRLPVRPGRAAGSRDRAVRPHRPCRAQQHRAVREPDPIRQGLGGPGRFDRAPVLGGGPAGGRPEHVEAAQPARALLGGSDPTAAPLLDDHARPLLV